MKEQIASALATIRNPNSTPLEVWAAKHQLKSLQLLGVRS